MKRIDYAALAAIVTLCGSAWALPPEVRVVRQGAIAGGSGQSWQDAYATVQEALDEAAAAPGSVTEIWVAQGQYPPTRERFLGESASRTFLLVEGVALYGGFAGTEVQRAERDPVRHPTQLTGLALSPRPHHIITADNIASATVDGFVISGGQAAGQDEHSRGGGVFIKNASPEFANCTIAGNTALAGGGITIIGGSPKFSRCAIEANEVSSATLGGAGILLQSGAVVIEDSRITANTAVGPISGGGLAVVGGSAVLSRCRITGNYAQTGGALYSAGGSVEAVNSLFMENFGGLVGQNLTVINCTIIRNPAPDPGVWSGVNGTGMLVNSIVWGNAEEDWEGIAPQVWGGIQASYSCIEPNTIGPVLSGPGLLRCDPLLTPAGAPAAYSPVIDAGSNSALDGKAALDLDKRVRFVDDPGLPDRGQGHGPMVDLGALEFQGVTCYPNCDGSTAAPILNISDFTCFMNRFASGDPLSNCDGSTTAPILNVADFACFAARFSAGCP